MIFAVRIVYLNDSCHYNNNKFDLIMQIYAMLRAQN